MAPRVNHLTLGWFWQAVCDVFVSKKAVETDDDDSELWLRLN